jgi:hypothetical protein
MTVPAAGPAGCSPPGRRRRRHSTMACGADSARPPPALATTMSPAAGAGRRTRSAWCRDRGFVTPAGSGRRLGGRTAAEAWALAWTAVGIHCPDAAEVAVAVHPPCTVRRQHWRTAPSESSSFLGGHCSYDCRSLFSSGGDPKAWMVSRSAYITVLVIYALRINMLGKLKQRGIDLKFTVAGANRLKSSHAHGAPHFLKV